jgi:hypothetical protein
MSGWVRERASEGGGREERAESREQKAGNYGKQETGNRKQEGKGNG